MGETCDQNEQPSLRQCLTMWTWTGRIKKLLRGRGLISTEWLPRRGLKRTAMPLKRRWMYCSDEFIMGSSPRTHQPGLTLFQEILTQETSGETSHHRSLEVVRSCPVYAVHGIRSGASTCHSETWQVQ
eukprot:06234_6